jgi:hypothetical protein
MPTSAPTDCPWRKALWGGILRKNMNAYPLNTYKSRPPFNYFYKSIKHILEEKDQLIVGWSIDNDVRYVYDACKRYNLNQINYQYIDLQKIVMKMEELVRESK